MHETLKKGAADRGLKGLSESITQLHEPVRHGPMVVVYPEDVWYAGVDREGALRILDEHLVGGRPVEELRYVAPPGDNKLVND